tara:strand:+ start:154 stop:372 length:219 start_codon:yes stop_codon:yes gene_type:complete
MNKSEWIYLANAMWTYAEKHDGKISSLLKELVIKVNKNMEMITNELDDNGENVRSDRPTDTNATNSDDFKES